MTQDRKRGLFLIFLMLGTIAIVAYVLLPVGGPSSVLYAVIGLGSAFAILIGSRHLQPDHPAAWRLIAAGVGLSAIADFMWAYYEFGLDVNPGGSLADVFYLAYYPLVAAGVLVMTRSRTSERGRETLLDASIFAAGIGLVVWQITMRPTFAQPDMSAFGVFATLAYPLMDTLLIVVVFRFVFVPGLRVPATWFLIGGLGLTLVGDQLYAMTDLGHLIDPLWLVGYLLMGLAALHPSMTVLTDPSDRHGTQLGGLRRVLLILALVGSLAVLIPILPSKIRGADVLLTGLFALVVVTRFLFLGVRADRQVVAQLKTEASLREAEARYRALVERIPAVTFAEVPDADAEFKYRSTYVSPQVEDIFGITVAGWMSDPHLWRDSIHPDDRERVLAFVGDPTWIDESYRIEYRVTPRPGEVRWIREDSQSVRDADGNPVGWQSLAFDITEEKAAESATHARVAAESANQAKSQFLSRVSHEFRTPLNAILGFGQLLETEHLSKGQREGVAEIMAGGHHLLELVDEIMKLSEIESGERGPTIGAVALDPILAKVVDIMAPLADLGDVDLQMPMASTDTWILADPQIMLDVVLRLVSNAIRYNTRPGQVELSWQASPEGMLLLDVRDTGPGIRDEQLPLLWQPFERLTADTSRIPGRGMGLALARRQVEAMGGSITVASRVGVGSTFTVGLVLAESPSRLDA